MAQAVSDMHLLGAIVTTLRADTGADGLKVLTGYTSDRDFRIGRHLPNNKEKQRYLGVWLFRSVPKIEGGYVGHLQKTRVRFYCSAKTKSSGELTANKIADRLDNLLVPEQEVANSPNRSYLDFSDSNISCKSTTRKSRVGSRYDEDNDLWTLWVDAEVIWVNKPCP